MPASVGRLGNSLKQQGSQNEEVQGLVTVGTPKTVFDPGEGYPNTAIGCFHNFRWLHITSDFFKIKNF